MIREYFKWSRLNGSSCELSKIERIQKVISLLTSMRLWKNTPRIRKERSVQEQEQFHHGRGVARKADGFT